MLLERHILELEEELLKIETRQSVEKISELLTNEFVEFCSSGYVYHYSKGDVFGGRSNSSKINWEIREFYIKYLSTDSVLATYKLIQHGELREDIKYSLRSSIWKCLNGKWKMIFHQGTLTSKI